MALPTARLARASWPTRFRPKNTKKRCIRPERRCGRWSGPSSWSRKGPGMLLLLDNYDSFTYNLYQYLCELGAGVVVRRNDQTTLEEIESLAPAGIVISPGPCTPDEAGVCNEVIRLFGPRLPILGVCLGHQCLGQVYGGRVIRAPIPMHGKISRIQHQGAGVLAGLPQPFDAV